MDLTMNPKSSEVFLLDKEDIPSIVDVLCDSFAQYPVMHYIHGSDINYDQWLKILINFFVTARILREEIIYGINDQANLVGVALTSNPDNSPDIAELE